jgi:DNA-binding HxlR family transcriptional regulator
MVRNMNQQKNLDARACPVARALDVIGDRWSLLVVRDAFDGIRRFGDFQRSLGVARNILSERLRRLVDASVLAMQAASDNSAYQEYVLTEQGKALFPLVVALRQWGEGHLFAEHEPHSALVEKKTGRPLQAMRPQAMDGHAISPAETEVRKLS